MGLRVRKIITLLPGVRLNVSKSGGSMSFGGKGFTVNVGPKGTRGTVGLPGSGISYSNIKKRGGAQGWFWTIFFIAAALAFYYYRG